MAPLDLSPYLLVGGLPAAQVGCELGTGPCSARCRPGLAGVPAGSAGAWQPVPRRRRLGNLMLIGSGLFFCFLACKQLAGCDLCCAQPFLVKGHQPTAPSPSPVSPKTPGAGRGRWLRGQDPRGGYGEVRHWTDELSCGRAALPGLAFLRKELNVGDKGHLGVHGTRGVGCVLTVFMALHEGEQEEEVFALKQARSRCQDHACSAFLEDFGVSPASGSARVAARSPSWSAGDGKAQHCLRAGISPALLFPRVQQPGTP